MVEPMGYQFPELLIQGFVSGSNYDDLQKDLEIKQFTNIIYQSGWQRATDLCFQLTDLKLTPKTRYVVTMRLKDGADHQWQVETWFETGLMTQQLAGEWIGTSHSDLHGIELVKQFNVPQGVQQARLYVTGLGLYEVYLDGMKVGSEYLAPGFTNYSYYTQLATHDVSASLATAGQHELVVRLADGWYRGKLGLNERGGIAANYGNALMTNAELDYQGIDGIAHRVITDHTWVARLSPVTHSGLYYGEDYDVTQTDTKVPVTTFEQPSKYVVDRLSLPITTHERLAVKKVIRTNHGDTVLDFGQNFAGWVIFKDRLVKGTKIQIEFGEIMQNSEFYRENLRSARATFTYVSDGKGNTVRPHFTYFGFRYARLVNFSEVDPDDFQGIALYSDMRTIGAIETDQPLVNRFFKNVQWGQKSNFMDVPTDCPQRDERLGWTGDAQIFAKTASYNMDTYQFFTKYSFDMAVEQSLHQGKVTLYAPAVGQDDGGKAVWSDATTIIPWTMYERTGDAIILTQRFGAMASWVDWIHDRATSKGHPFLWLGDDQLGDWLALDTDDIMHLKGRTPDDLIASAYYYYSASIVAKAATVLGKQPEQDYYQNMADNVKQAFLNEFFTKTGRFITDTQTALALCLNLGLFPENQTKKMTAQLIQTIEKNQNHLTTGFVGTPQLLPALSSNQAHGVAVALFLNQGFPGWLYEVAHGATTIWERWDSVEPDGTINDNGMNSLNHYSAGAVMQWAYEYLVGIQQSDAGRVLTINPGITPEFRHVNGQTEINNGVVKVDWQLLNSAGSKVEIHTTIPFGIQARLQLPRATEYLINGQKYRNGDLLAAGEYVFTYVPATPFLAQFSVHTQLEKYCQDADLTRQLSKLVPFWSFLALPGNMEKFEKYSLLQLSSEMRGIGFKPFNQQDIQTINQVFTNAASRHVQEEEQHHA
ncbi:family 78 glycoside hydrolase catalytic domain [Lactiplantibacillus sp. DA1]|uniref:alpha-L-rhamnosidase n=1 Tax=Lactiplantibacillus sp. DA1 TaxID=3079857 RepID=UPI00292A61A1|nr:family 78 glycoside hydrolase catalytic domain [Lactiplantibacillus sp. DA1]MDV0430702.1 family 78 glycoside hydrolase catalytic domain [Lactiplantibacillus sp. DA1]